MNLDQCPTPETSSVVDGSKLKLYDKCRSLEQRLALAREALDGVIRNCAVMSSTKEGVRRHNTAIRMAREAHTATAPKP